MLARREFLAAAASLTAAAAYGVDAQQSSSRTSCPFMHNIFTKLNVLSRTEAVTVASHRGLVKL